MTTKQAAALIGVSISYLKALIKDGKIKAKKVKTTTNRHGYLYDVDRASAVKFKNTPHSNSGLRGQPRNRKKASR